MWRRADDDLWVATVDGEYGGMITRLPDGYHVHDRFSRPVAVVPTLAEATGLRAPSRHGVPRARRARAHTVRTRPGATTGPRFAGPSHQREKTP
ncbi:hypothetical protein GCM10027054_34140 [Isoptericola nanjingensis]